MTVLNLLLVFILGILLSALWFVLLMLIMKRWGKFAPIRRLGTVIAAAIPTIIILLASNRYYFKLSGLTDYISWIILAVTVALTSFIVSFNKADTLPKGKSLLLYGLDGALMEVPQRWMMQAFVILLLRLFGLDELYSIPITALVWCASICMQLALQKGKFTKKVVIDLVSSFVFSFGIGLVFIRANFIVMTMLAHFSERLLSTAIRRLRYRG